MGIIDLRSRISGDRKLYWLGVIRTSLIYGVVTLTAGIIVLKITLYIPVFNNWPYNIPITGYAAKILLSLSLLLILNEILVTRHPHYDVWLLAALGGVVGVIAW